MDLLLFRVPFIRVAIHCEEVSFVTDSSNSQKFNILPSEALAGLPNALQRCPVLL